MGGKLKTHKPAWGEGQRQQRGKGISAGFPSGLTSTIHPGPGSEMESTQVGAEATALNGRGAWGDGAASRLAAI